MRDVFKNMVVVRAEHGVKVAGWNPNELLGSWYGGARVW